MWSCRSLGHCSSYFDHSLPVSGVCGGWDHHQPSRVTRISFHLWKFYHLRNFTGLFECHPLPDTHHMQLDPVYPFRECCLQCCIGWHFDRDPNMHEGLDSILHHPELYLTLPAQSLLPHLCPLSPPRRMAAHCFLTESVTRSFLKTTTALSLR